MKNTWSLINRIKLSSNISKFEFSCKEVSIKNYVKGVSWFGRHFSIRAGKSNPKTRLYTTVLCYTQNNISFRENIIKFYESQMIGDIDEENLKVMHFDLASNLLPLIIKRYDFPNALSAMLHDSNHETFDVQGPMGTGLELHAGCNGTYIIICGGTGILPFVDLLDYLLKKSIYTVLLNKFGRHTADKVNPCMEDYENTFGNKFKVKLFCSLKNEDEFKYLNFIQKLYEINKNNGLSLFDLIMRFDDPSNIHGIPLTKSYFDQNFLKENLVLDEIARVFICGNPTMNKFIPDMCQQLNIEKEKIYLV